MPITSYRLVFGFILALAIAAPVACGKKDAQPKLAGNANPAIHEKAPPPLPAERNQLAGR